MEKFALLASIEAKPGKENEVVDFLTSALPLPQTGTRPIRWHAWSSRGNTFGIFDTFETEDGRSEHLQVQIAAALHTNADHLLSKKPEIEFLDLITVK